MKNPDGGSSGRTNPGADWNPHDVREVLMDFEGTVRMVGSCLPRLNGELMWRVPGNLTEEFHEHVFFCHSKYAMMFGQM